jgi:hypothetical protein
MLHPPEKTMTAYRVNKLDGPLLDAAIAKAEGHNFRVFSEAASPIGRPLTIAWRQHYTEGDADEFEASSDWAVGGPIIERERISVIRARDQDDWEAYVNMPTIIELDDEPPIARGPTPLVAAMRAYLVSKVGEEIELPD